MGCVQLFHRGTHGVKNITQMRSAFVFVRPTERSDFLGATHQSENLSHQQRLMCLSRRLRAMHQGIKNTRYDGAQILESQHGKCENQIVT